MQIYDDGVPRKVMGSRLEDAEPSWVSRHLSRSLYH